MRCAVIIGKGPIGLANGIDNQCVAAFVMADRFSYQDGFGLAECGTFRYRPMPSLRQPPGAIRLNQPFSGCGEPMLRQVGRMGFDGIISKRRGSRYLSGRSPDWLFSRMIH